MQDQQARSEVGDEAPVRARAAPLPEIIWTAPGRRSEGVVERLVCVCGQCAVREGDVQEEDLHKDGEQGLDKERGAEVRAEPVEDSVTFLSANRRVQGWRGYFKILATSMISGMSSEKPAELRVLWIE